MSLLDQASLVITPNGYKESVLYSVVPNTTLGDMDVVRATTATRVNSAGLIEVVPRNLVTYSEQFNNSDWGKYQSSITANTINSPNGTLTADTITDNTATDVHIVNQGINIVAGIYTLSVYAKANTLSNINLQLYDGVSLFYSSNAFNLSTGTTTGSNQSIQSVGDGWYKCSFTTTTTQTGVQYTYVVLNNGVSSYYTGTGKSLYIWGAQLEQGSTATEYFPTTTRLNIPRIDYTNGSCPSLLVEPQRTNLLTYSNDYSNVSYSNLNLTVNNNSTISPDGTNNANKLLINSTGVTGIYKEISVTSGNYYTTSVFIKKAETQYVNLGFIYSAGTYGGVQFDLNSGTIIRTFSATYTNPSSTITNLNNGWFKLTFSCIINTATAYPTILPSNTQWTSGELRQTLTGNNTTGAYFYGFQLEAGSYATSYIPTVASAITRNADVISKTGISSLIGQTEGTIYADIKYDSNIGSTKIITGLATGTSSFIYYFISGTTLVLSIYNSGTLQCYLTYALPSSGRYKIAMGYKLNDFIIYVNGANVASQTIGSVPSCSNLYLGNDFLTVYNKLEYNSAILWKERLSNSELAQLTTI